MPSFRRSDELTTFFRRSALDATDEQLQANLRATAEGYRRSVKRLEARGEDEKAAEMRELADRTEREARALTQRQAPPDLLDDEPELFQNPRQAKGGQK
jgi:hypothetical protein